MIVESHSHISLDLGGTESASTHYGMEPDSIDAYLRAYDQNKVDACYVFGLRSFWDSAFIQRENTELAKLRKQYPRRLFPWGCVNPSWPEQEVRAEIRRMANDLGLYGIKLVPICQGFPISGSGMDVVAEEAIRYHLPIFFHDGSPEYCSAVQVAYYARKYPELRVVSGHGGLREHWPDLIPAVRELPNLWVCLSGPTQWGIQTLYDELGPEKLLFGSDGGLGHPSVIKAYLRRVERLQAPEEHKKMILGDNAMQLLFGDAAKKSRT